MYIILSLLGFTLPLTLLIMGLIFYKHPPENINSFAGYRTARSMKNMETWKEANKYSSKLMIKFSLPLVLITGLTIIAAGKSYELLAVVILASTVLGTVVIIIAIILTEKHLKNMFGK